ncbi:hypothetical protein [Kiloniella sp. b19]|uniref:hypothetical protein n=1 Tax=Kiloniella sp. GXU_MW_B19 TaxID=3141326 RepID=UPI0031DAFD20
MKKFFIPLILLSGLGACADPYVTSAASVGTLITTDKTITDHVVSWAMAEDCSAIEWSKGEEYCVEEGSRNSSGPQPTLYCYRTLGGTTCYDKPYEDASSNIKVYTPPSE